MSVSVVSKILRPFAHTLTPGDKHSFDNREILKQPIQIQLSQALKGFSQFFTAFLHLILNISKKEMSPIAYVFPKLYTAKDTLV